MQGPDRATPPLRPSVDLLNEIKQVLKLSRLKQMLTQFKKHDHFSTCSDNRAQIVFSLRDFQKLKKTFRNMGS